MKSSDLQATLDRHNKAKSEIAQLEILSSDTSARLAALEVSCDLADAKALGEITRLQVVGALLPRRITNRQEAFVQSAAELLSACHKFISDSLGPKRRELEIRIRERVTAALRPHFSNEADLGAAVGKSSQVREVEDLSWPATITSPPTGGLVAYAERILATWSKVEELGNKTS